MRIKRIGINGIFCQLTAITVVMLYGYGGAVFAHEGDNHHTHKVIPKVLAAEMYRPTPLPDRVILTLSSDPATTQSVTWRTSTDVTDGIAEIAVAEAGPYFSEKANQIHSEIETLKSDLSTAHFHSVTFRDLQPDTQYVYRVGDGENWTEWFQFRTASTNGDGFQFVYFGDAQNNLRSKWSRVIREAYRDAPRAAFLLHAGDLVNRGASDAEWGEWFGAGGWLNATTPSLAVPGNHEQSRKKEGQPKTLTEHWRPTFVFPENGPSGLEETCYTLVYKNMRLIALDSNREIERQAEWMDELLEGNQSEWVVCVFHHPIYSTGKDRDNTKLRAAWKPIFDKHRVDLVLQGHDHTYGRTTMDVPESLETTNQTDPTIRNVPTGLKTESKTAGTIYVVSVSGPKMYNNNRKPFMARVAEDTQLYQIIDVTGSKLTFRAFTALGEVYDAFELNKRPGQVNEIVEIEPDVPENLRPVLQAVK